ncbi:hypothetical protein SOPP22_13155 [Shewanella sp. OPT22]|nr:hypothetical protein SOPP22_13155 [Shewanella sp. OPT22]
MVTTIRVGVKPFYADSTFPHGLSRSGYFCKREAEELKIYGYSLEGLANGSLTPLNEEEALFIREINANSNCTLPLCKLWKKYLNAVTQSQLKYGFSVNKTLEKPFIRHSVDKRSIRFVLTR